MASGFGIDKTEKENPKLYLLGGPAGVAVGSLSPTCRLVCRGVGRKIITSE